MSSIGIGALSRQLRQFATLSLFYFAVIEIQHIQRLLWQLQGQHQGQQQGQRQQQQHHNHDDQSSSSLCGNNGGRGGGDGSFLFASAAVADATSNTSGEATATSATSGTAGSTTALSAGKLRSMGENALMQKQYAEAEGFYRAAIEVEPHNALNYFRSVSFTSWMFQCLGMHWNLSVVCCHCHCHCVQNLLGRSAHAPLRALGIVGMD